MSTYLLFFGLGDLERLSVKAGATEVGVVTRRGASAQARFALDSSRDVLREYDDYFGVPYPLPKLDNVASPGGNQFFGAMENWGAIFTFERCLLLDPMLSSQTDRQAVFSVAAHEIAHQWFGNLVTMRWWDDLWLNEGFATWMEGRTTRKLHPEWDTATAAVAARSFAMDSDAFATTHPIVQPVLTVDQASQAFDEITYAKGAAVIGMLESYVGADAWRDGVRRYLRAHAYGNAVSDDLWRAIDAASDRPVAEIAHDFTRQPGVPLLRVVSSRCDDGRTTLDLAQGEFSTDRPDKAPLRWQIPVIARVAGNAPARTVVADRTGDARRAGMRHGDRQCRADGLLPDARTHRRSRPACGLRSRASTRSTSSASSTTPGRSAWPVLRRSPMPSSWSRASATTPIRRSGAASPSACARSMRSIASTRCGAPRGDATPSAASHRFSHASAGAHRPTSARRRRCCGRG